jgi:hypothetical protein
MEVPVTRLSRAWLLHLTLASTLCACVTADDEATPSPAFVVTPPAGSQQTELRVDVPAGVTSYTAAHPVTFGVPFARGVLFDTHMLRIVNAAGDLLQASFDRKNRWDDGSIKWVQIDLIMSVTAGVPHQTPYYLQYGPTVPMSPAPTSPLVVTSGAGGFTVDTQVVTHTFTPATDSIGRFVLIEDDGGVLKEFVAKPTTVEHETGDLYLPAIADAANTTRATIKVTGRYLASDGASSTDYITRYRFYARTAAVQIDHTIVRTEAHDASRIAALWFEPMTSPIGTTVTYGLDGATQTTSVATSRYQSAPHTVVNELGTTVGSHLDGWIQENPTLRTARQFIALRWPWQQFPTRIDAASTGGALSSRVYLIGPRPGAPLALTPGANAIPPLLSLVVEQWDMAAGKAPYLNQIDGERMDALGVGKSWELVFWQAPSTDATYALAPAVRNTLVQQPIYVSADPAFAVAAGLPGPNAPVASPPTLLDRTMDDVFDWVTRTRDDEYDYGIWNFGDVQYDWTPPNAGNGFVSSTQHRYWANHGKGWPAVPWMMWLRSGAREYLAFAETNARHLMDVDTSHIDDYDLRKFRGGTYIYEPLHFGQASYPAHIGNDSEYLTYAWHVAGIDRARDIILEREHALLTDYADLDIKDLAALIALIQNATHPDLACDRDQYRSFGELAIVYDETHNAALKSRAEQLLELFEACQADNGFMNGIKTAEWFDTAFLLAARAFPDLADRIFEVLRRWEQHRGSPGRPGATGQVSGPISLWTLYELEAQTGDPSYANVVIGVANARAHAIVHADDLTNPADPQHARWRGSSGIDGIKLASSMRDWMAASRRAVVPGAPTGTAPLPYLSGNLPVSLVHEDNVTKNVVYVRETTDTAFSVTLDFFEDNAGGDRMRIRVFPPDATMTSAPSQVIETTFENRTSQVPGATSVDDASDYAKTHTVSIPADNKHGAYAIEVTTWSTPSAFAMSATSTLGPVVHFVPSYQERLQYMQAHAATQCPVRIALAGGGTIPPATSPPFPANEACSMNLYRRYLATVKLSSGALAGQVWFKPAAGAAVDVGFAGTATTSPAGVTTVAPYEFPTKVIIHDGVTARCSTKVTGTTAGATPLLSRCAFSAAAPTLHSMVVANETSWTVYLGNTGSFLATTQAQWFDLPAQAPPKERFLTFE